MTVRVDCDVLIVGAGPTGVALGLLLAQSDVRTIVVDKEADIYPLPRAAHIDHEIVRIFQELGLADTIMATSRTAPRYDFLTADRQILLRFEGLDRTGPGGWPASNMIHQPSLEAALRGKIAKQSGVELRRNWTFNGFDESESGVTARLSTPDGTKSLGARYLVGADGARSPVREAAGILFDDLNFDEPWLVVDAIVKDPSRLPDINLQICDPARPTTCVLMGEGRHRWEFMIKPGETPENFVKDEFIQSLLAPWNIDGAVTLERKAVYRFNAKVAKEWRKGRVLLAGDAAHQMPPFAGQGLCSGLRDAANLAWKLAAIIKGAPDALLDSYQPEREPNVRGIIGMAIMMGRTVCITDAQAAAARDAEMVAAARAGPAGAPVYPPIADGCILKGSAGAGAYFPQPCTEDNPTRRLDDALGRGPWLIARAGFDELTELTGLRAALLDDAALVPFAGEIGSWLRLHDAESVLVRADRYVFGTGSPARLVHAWNAAVT